MNIAIVGGGAIGLLVAAYVTKAKMNPIIYTRREEQKEAINKYGIELFKNETKALYNCKAERFTYGMNNDEDLIIVTVKQYDIKAIIDYLIENKITTPILFLQNGMSHIPLLKDLCAKSIYLGIVEHGVFKHSDTSITHTGDGQIKIGLYRGELAESTKVWNALHAIGFPIIIEKEWYPVLIKKLVVNAVINPLTALYKVKNGQLLDNPYYFENMKSIFNEVVKVVNLDKTDELWNDVVQICRKTGNNYSSMYKDIENKRQTEIQSILGYLLEEGKRKHIAMPLGSFLYFSIRGMETIRERDENA